MKFGPFEIINNYVSHRGGALGRECNTAMIADLARQVARLTEWQEKTGKCVAALNRQVNEPNFEQPKPRKVVTLSDNTMCPHRRQDTVCCIIKEQANYRCRTSNSIPFPAWCPLDNA